MQMEKEGIHKLSCGLAAVKVAAMRSISHTWPSVAGDREGKREAKKERRRSKIEC